MAFLLSWFGANNVSGGMDTIQVYVPDEESTLSRKFGKAFCDVLKEQMKQYGVKTVEVSRAEIQPDKILIVLCYNYSRIGTDISAAMSQLEDKGIDYSFTAVVVYHTYQAHALPCTMPTDNLSEEYEKYGCLLDMTYDLDKEKLRDCDMNKKGAKKLQGFLEGLIPKPTGPDQMQHGSSGKETESVPDKSSINKEEEPDIKEFVQRFSSSIARLQSDISEMNKSVRGLSKDTTELKSHTYKLQTAISEVQKFVREHENDFTERGPSDDAMEAEHSVPLSHLSGSHTNDDEVQPPKGDVKPEVSDDETSITVPKTVISSRGESGAIEKAHGGESNSDPSENNTSVDEKETDHSAMESSDKGQSIYVADAIQTGDSSQRLLARLWQRVLEGDSSQWLLARLWQRVLELIRLKTRKSSNTTNNPSLIHLDDITAMAETVSDVDNVLDDLQAEIDKLRKENNNLRLMITSFADSPHLSEQFSRKNSTPDEAGAQACVQEPSEKSPDTIAMEIDNAINDDVPSCTGAPNPSTPREEGHVKKETE